MIYRIEYTNQRCCDLVNGRSDLLKKIKILKGEEIADIRKVYKNGISDSVYDIYQSEIRRARS
jgi:hypothetical protein